MKKRESKIEDKSQSSIFDFADEILSKEEKLELIQSNQNRIEEPSKSKGDNLNNEDESSNLRSEQIIISKNNYPSIRISDNKYQFNQSIDNISKSCHHSKNLYNQCLYQIRLSFFNKINLNLNSINPEKEKQLRIDILKELNKYKNSRYEDLKNKNYKNSIYNLLDKYFKDQSKNRSAEAKENDNYSWSPQASQQIIDKCVEAWLDNDLGRRDYDQHPDHRKDYTGRPNLPNYRKSSEFLSVFTNQQCKIEKKETVENTKDLNTKWLIKYILTFPEHLNIRPILIRLNNQIYLREVRIIPLIMKGCYKVEIIYQKAIDKIKLNLNLNLNKENIIGIDLGKVNTVTIANNIEKRPIVVKGGFVLSINQWYNKLSSKLYKIYYRQQKFTGQKGQKIEIGNKLKIQIQNRLNRNKDLFHKLSRYIINYCIENKIGTIIIGRNPFWKQNIKLGDRTNQNFVYIPFDILIKMIKYKGKEIGIDVIVHEEAHTSKCSFLDSEEICHHDKYIGERLTKKGHRGLFRTALGRLINSDVNGAYNIIKKVRPNAFDFKGHGIRVGEVLHPVSISIKDLLSRPRTWLDDILEIFILRSNDCENMVTMVNIIC